jgi:hypothetical protein
VELEALTLETMASGHLCLRLTERVDYADVRIWKVGRRCRTGAGNARRRMRGPDRG